MCFSDDYSTHPPPRIIISGCGSSGASCSGLFFFFLFFFFFRSGSPDEETEFFPCLSELDFDDASRDDSFGLDLLRDFRLDPSLSLSLLTPLVELRTSDDRLFDFVVFRSSSLSSRFSLLELPSRLLPARLCLRFGGSSGMIELACTLAISPRTPATTRTPIVSRLSSSMRKSSDRYPRIVFLAFYEKSSNSCPRVLRTSSSTGDALWMIAPRCHSDTPAKCLLNERCKTQKFSRW